MATASKNKYGFRTEMATTGIDHALEKCDRLAEFPNFSAIVETSKTTGSIHRARPTPHEKDVIRDAGQNAVVFNTQNKRDPRLKELDDSHRATIGRYWTMVVRGVIASGGRNIYGVIDHVKRISRYMIDLYTKRVDSGTLKPVCESVRAQKIREVGPAVADKAGRRTGQMLQSLTPTFRVRK